ncbi:glycosyltransferase family 2 protein [Terrisporobacter sp.]
MKISIIVPIYNVEEYINECLDSLANQTLKEIEVIMINDGSTDKSPLIAKEYEKKYDNFKLISQENGGLGKARNVGVGHATGMYIAFVDSDDYVSLDAYEKLYNAAVKNNCDITTGNVRRFNSNEFKKSKIHKIAIKKNLENVNIEEHLELIYDSTAWNKIYKRSFWIENNLKFPEGILYEDLPVTIPAYFLSKSTTVIKDIIYFWRIREGENKSITQNRNQINNFVDRVKSLRLVDEFFNTLPYDNAKNYRYYKWLELDFMIYINQLDNTSEEYRKIFLEIILDYLKDIPNEIFDNLKAINRIKYFLLKNRDLDTLLKVIEYQRESYKYALISKENQRFYLNIPFDNIPKHLLDVTNELTASDVKTKIQKIKFKDNYLILRGYFYIPKVELLEKEDVVVKARLINQETKEKIKIKARNYHHKKLTNKVNNDLIDINNSEDDNNDINIPHYNYDWGGYNLKIDLSNEELLNNSSSLYKILITIQIGDIKKKFYVNNPKKDLSPTYEEGFNKVKNVKFNYNKKNHLILSFEE